MNWIIPHGSNHCHILLICCSSEGMYTWHYHRALSIFLSNGLSRCVSHSHHKNFWAFTRPRTNLARFHWFWIWLYRGGLPVWGVFYWLQSSDQCVSNWLPTFIILTHICCSDSVAQWHHMTSSDILATIGSGNGMLPVSYIWKHHQMETFSALMAICVGNSPVPGEFPTQRPVTQSFDVYFVLRLNKRLCKQSWGWWFETLLCPLWRHSNENLHEPVLAICLLEQLFGEIWFKIP